MKFSSSELKYIVAPSEGKKIYTFPDIEEPQIVFIGRSNVGKSSLINKLTGFPKLARISSEPGKTRQLNYYFIDKKYYFVDLPGYGFAKISGTMRKAWSELIEQYFQRQNSISLGVLVVDIRRDPVDSDIAMIKWLEKYHIQYIIVLNKSDKISNNEIAKKNQLYRKILSKNRYFTDVYLFSCFSSIGKNELIKVIKGYLDK